VRRRTTKPAPQRRSDFAQLRCNPLANGYPAQVHVRDDNVTVYSRRGYDWTQTFAFKEWPGQTTAPPSHHELIAITARSRKRR
jgi:hypothetical protein